LWELLNLAWRGGNKKECQLRSANFLHWGEYGPGVHRGDRYSLRGLENDRQDRGLILSRRPLAAARELIKHITSIFKGFWLAIRKDYRRVTMVFEPPSNAMVGSW
jgi:hypothetical protein